MSIIKMSYVFLFLLSSCVQLCAQNIKVERFQILNNDITARVSPVKDANDDDCALIKMLTVDRDYCIDDTLKRVFRTGEIWFYVPQGTKRIIIRHPSLGKEFYEFPEPLKGKATYELKLPDNVEIIVHEDVGGQYLALNVQPLDAVVYIDGVPETISNGVLTKLMKYGNHTYKIEAPLHHSLSGNFVIGHEKKYINISLKPNYGFLQIASVPENGASIYIDDVLIGKTPINKFRLLSGFHRIRATLPLYYPLEKNVVIKSEQNEVVDLDFSATFAQISLFSAADTEIWINNEKKGVGQWKGRLSPGLYTFETRKKSHRPFCETKELKAGENLSLTLKAPTAMSGSLHITCNQVEAKVEIDGKYIGTVPDVFQNILAGIHMVKIIKEGFESEKYEVVLTEGKVTELHAVLNNKAIVYTKDKIDFSKAPFGSSEKRQVVVLGDLAYVLLTSEEKKYIGPTHHTNNGRTYHCGTTQITKKVKGFYKYDFIQNVWVKCQIPPWGTARVGKSYALGGGDIIPKDFSLTMKNGFLLSEGMGYNQQTDKWYYYPITKENLVLPPLLSNKSPSIVIRDNYVYLMQEDTGNFYIYNAFDDRWKMGKNPFSDIGKVKLGQVGEMLIVSTIDKYSIPTYKYYSFKNNDWKLLIQGKRILFSIEAPNNDFLLGVDLEGNKAHVYCFDLKNQKDFYIFPKQKYPLLNYRLYIDNMGKICFVVYKKLDKKGEEIDKKVFHVNLVQQSLE